MFVLFALLFSMVAATNAAEDAAPIKIIIDAAHETAHSGEMEDLPAKLEAWGYTVEMVTDEITSGVLSDAKILIVPMPMRPIYSQEELDAVAEWFDAGNVAIWVAGDSDYDGPEYVPATNTILEKIGSNILIENASVEEPNELYNDGSAYRVVASSWNADSPIATGVSKEVFHGPTFLYGVKNGDAVDLATAKIDNVTWIAKSSPEAIIVSPHLSPIMTPGYEAGSSGTFVFMASQDHAGADESSKIVVTSEAIFTSYKFMNTDGPSEKGNHELQGETLLKNAIEWMELESEESGSNTTMYAGIAVVVIIIIAAAAFAMRKK